MIIGLHHTGFVVEDLERAVAFYRDVVGMEVVSRYERTGPGIEQVIGYEGAHLKIAHMGAGGEQTLELIQYLNPPPDRRPTGERSVLGASHLAIQVDDIEECFERLVAGGAKPLNPPTELAPGRTACYLQDPDGNWLELIQLAE
jgi:catechol 2,3-dioxygenase-like lactoylglutathione lyase family enzyme